MTVRAVLEPEQVGNLIQRKAEPLGRFDKTHPRHVGRAIAANATVGLVRLGQQPLALIKPDRFHIDVGRPGNGPNGQALRIAEYTP